MLSCLTLQLVSSTVVYAQDSSTQGTVTTDASTNKEENQEATDKNFEVNKGIEVIGVSNNKEILIGEKGEFKLTGLNLPEGIEKNDKIKPVFKSSDKSILSIEEDGKWKALKEGKVTLEFGYQLDAGSQKALEDAGFKIIDTLNKIELTIGENESEWATTIRSEGMSISLKDEKGATVNPTNVIVEGKTYKINPVMKEIDKKATYEFLYYWDKESFDISYDKKTGEAKATAKKSGVSTIKYGYIMKSGTESSTDSSSSSTDSPTSTSDSVMPESSYKKVKTAKKSAKAEQEAANAVLAEADTKNMIAEAFAVKESDGKTFLTNYGMTISPIEPITVGDKGTLADKIKINFPTGINFKGSYVFNAPPAMLTMNQDGTYVALKDGTVKVSYGYLLDPNVLNQLAIDKDFDLMELALKEKYIDIEIKKEDGKNPLEDRPILHKGMSVLLPDTITVGEEYKFKLNVDPELNFDGEFKIDYDKDLFDIKLNGNEGTLVAKKTGKVSFYYGYIPSEEMYQKLVEKNDGKPLSNDPGTYTMDVQAVKKPDPIKKGNGTNYPQTGETRNNWILISGVVVIATAGVMVWYQNKRKKISK